MSESETEWVWIPSGMPSTERHIHQDPECDGLDLARKPTRKDRSVLYDDEEECSICWGEETATDGGRAATVERSQLQFERPEKDGGQLSRRFCVRLANESQRCLNLHAESVGSNISTVVRNAVGAHLETAAEDPGNLPYVVEVTTPHDRVTVRLSEYQKAALTDLANERGSSLSAEARTAIVHYLDGTAEEGDP